MKSGTLSFNIFSTRLSTAGLLLLLLVVFGGCSGRDVPVIPPGPRKISFPLYIQQNRPVGDYYATSGVVSRVEKVVIGDSIVERDVPSYGAQFTSMPGIEPATGVTVNTIPLSRHNDTDTLRIEGTNDLSLLLANDWSVTTPQGTISVSIPQLEALDSVKPFPQIPTNGVIRSDSSLTVQWKRPTTSTGGIYLEWQALNDTLVRYVSDGIGVYTIDYTDMQNLRGKGLVILSRFANIIRDFNGKKLVVTRLVQRSYVVNVQ